MSRHDKFLGKILRGTSDSNISFDGLCQILRRFGFEMRVHGSHHIFHKDGVDEILNLQPKGSNAKAYQVKQVRNLILKHKLAED
jgi:hypothetical protein